jgi:hypothetical protein
MKRQRLQQQARRWRALSLAEDTEQAVSPGSCREGEAGMKRLIALLEQRTLRTKLAIGFSLMLFVMFGIGSDALIGQRRLAQSLNDLHGQEMLAVSAIKEARFEYAQMGRIVRMVILAGDAAARERALTTGEPTGDDDAIEDARQRLYRRGRQPMASLVKSMRLIDAMSIARLPW